MFHIVKGNKDGHSSHCKECHYAYVKKWREDNRQKTLDYGKVARSLTKNKAKRCALQRKREAAKLKRTPNWLTPEDELYMQCLYSLAAMRSKYSGEPWDVDHILPLQGELVSGLHVPSNLRVIPSSENARKYNSYELQ